MCTYQNRLDETILMRIHNIPSTSKGVRVIEVLLYTHDYNKSSITVKRLCWDRFNSMFYQLIFFHLASSMSRECSISVLVFMSRECSISLLVLMSRECSISCLVFMSREILKCATSTYKMNGK